MQLTEIKNDLATINYSPALNKLMLSDFILIEDSNQSILAQIISIEATMESDVNSAMLKFLLSIDKEANLTQYSGYVPSKNATLILINPEEVVELIKGNDKNVFLGNLALYPDIPIELSLDFMRKRPYIQVDFVENKLQFVKTILKGLEKHNKKSILIDFQGIYENVSLPTVTLGNNFKLPLNYDALCYIAEEDLNDCNNENKAVIQGILIEVQNYVKSTQDGFIPFDTLISVLDAQYGENPMSELLLLKNKLLKYQQQGIFAQEKSEFDFLDEFLKDTKNFKIDLSELPAQWGKIALTSILNIIKAKCYLITDFTDDNSNKNIIRKLYEKTEIKPIVISSYEYKYQLQLKAMSKNMVLFKPIQKVEDFAGYTSFLNILSHDTFIVWGEQTLFIPLILKLQSDYKSENYRARIDINKCDKIQPEENINIDEQKESEIIYTNIEETSSTKEDLTEIPIETLEDVEHAEIIESVEPAESVESVEVEKGAEISSTIDKQVILDEAIEDESPATKEDFPQEETNAETDFDTDIVEDDLPNAEDLDFFFDDSNEEQEILIEQEEEKVETEDQDTLNIKPNYNENYLEDTDNSDEIVVENLEEVNVDETVIENTDQNKATIIQNKEAEDNILETETETAIPLTTDESNQKENTIEIKSPEIPVYTSNVAPDFDTKFAQGTYVHHPKYGRGVVEKVINYGSKELCLIIFDNEGRKLLDPNLAELKQV